MTKKVPFFIDLADHIREKGVFDLENDRGQYPTIHWVIARSMLDGLSEFDRHQLLTHTVSKVKGCFENAISYLRDQGIVFYRSRGIGKRNIQFISTDPHYKNCQEYDFKRQTKNVTDTVLSYQQNIRKMHPDMLPLIESEAKRFSNKLISLED